MIKVLVDNNIVFEGDIKFLSGGGTKSVYSLIGTDKVVLLPNEVDGITLINKFDRIRNEELEMYKFLQSISILSLKIELCDIVNNVNGNVMKGIYSPSFESYISQGLFIIDLKNSNTTYWKRENKLNEIPDNIESWYPIFKPLLNDFQILLENGILPYGDNLNLAVSKKDTYVLRYFGFDFSSKNYINKNIEKIKNGEKLDNLYSKDNMKELISTSVNYILPDEQYEDKDFMESLIAYLIDKYLIDK
jgi:hypothetical protein